MRLHRPHPMAWVLCGMISVLFARLPDIGVLGSMMFAMGPFFGYRNTPTLLDAALPVHGRALRGARMLVSSIVSLVPVAVWSIAVVAIGTTDEYTLGISGGVHPFQIAQIALSVLLLIVLPAALRPQTIGLPGAGTLGLAITTIILANAALLYFTAGWLGTVVIGVLLCATCAWTWQRVPEALQSAPREPRPAARAGKVGASTVDGWKWAAMRQLLHPITVAFALFGYFGGATGNTMQALMIGAFMSFSITVNRLSGLTALPVTPRVRLLLLLIPAVVLPGIMIGAGFFGPSPFTDHARWLGVGAPRTYGDGEQYFHSPTSSGVAFWKLAPKGQPPVIVSPAGETVEPFTVSFAGLTLYNPYSTRPESSPDFITWQFSRLTAVAYGQAMSQDEYRALRDEERLPQLSSRRPALRILNAGGMLSLSLMLVLSVVAAYRHTPARPSKLQRVEMVVPVVLYFGYLGVSMAMLNRYGDSVLSGVWQLFMIRIADALSGNIALVLLVATAPVALTYALLEWQFKHAEFPLMFPTGRR